MPTSTSTSCSASWWRRPTDLGALPRRDDTYYADDCGAAVERLRAGGVRVTAEPEDQPWGERVARVLDPDGNEVIIGQRAG